MASESKVSSDEKLQLGAEAARFSNIALIVGVVALGGGVALGLSDKPALLRGYLAAFLFVLAIGLGTLWFVAINHLTNAKWSIVIRRVAEVIAAQMPVLALLSLGIILPIALVDTHGHSPIQALYAWLDDARVHTDHLLHHKAPYLNKSFFLVRAVIYFGVWVGLSWLFFKKSVDQDKATSAESEKIRGFLASVSAPAMIAFALTLTFCAFDLLMSLDYTWFSTIFGVYYFAGCVIASMSTLVLALRWVQSHGGLKTYVNENHYHDLGKLMFAFTIFWAYCGFSQYMLIWYGDIPEETAWYKVRLTGDWWWVTAILPISNFIIPFFGLMSRHVKRNVMLLSCWAVYLLIARYYDLYWLIFPTDNRGVFSPSLVDILVLVGLLGIFFGMAARRLKGLQLVPKNDARLPQSLAFENY